MALGLCLLLVFSIPVTAKILWAHMEEGSQRISPDETPAADAVVVLSGAGITERGKSKAIEWQNPDRFLAGIDIFRSGKAPLLIFTGGWLPWAPNNRPEGEVLIEQARKLGVPESAVACTEKVSNTKEEAAAAARLLRTRQTGRAQPRIILVTSAYHMPRAKSLFEREGLAVLPFAVDFKSPPTWEIYISDFFPTTAALEACDKAIREIYGRVYYRVKP